MSAFLGIDTSNYTTSAAIYDTDSGIIHSKKLLPVKKGECGLRQNDAVFHHIQQLPEVVENICSRYNGKIDAIGVSSKPRDAEGSYMPCFTVGLNTARILSDMMKIPLYTFSHQNGHIAAALFSAGRTDLLHQRFLAFHVSGGTTEAVLVSPNKEKVFSVELMAKTLDLNAGQVIDRIGVMLGLQFPCGGELEKLALKNTEPIAAKATIKGFDCCLSGVENICQKMYEDGGSKEKVSAACLLYVQKALDEMCQKLLETTGDIPVIFSGGVMSNCIIRKNFSAKYTAYFAQPEFSSDNAAGISFLCSIQHSKTN